MNGFVIFDHQDLVERFLQTLKNNRGLQDQEKIVRSRTMACVMYRDLNNEEVSTVRRLAESHGGRVEESTKYVPVAG